MSAGSLIVVSSPALHCATSLHRAAQTPHRVSNAVSSSQHRSTSCCLSDGEPRAGTLIATEPSDEQLLRLAATGDGDALGQLYDRHARVMLGLATRLLRQREDAADLVHDVFVEAWQRAEQYDAERASVRSWLILRLRSRALDRLKSQNARLGALQRSGATLSVRGMGSVGGMGPVEGTGSEEGVGPDDGVARAADQERIKALLETLPEVQRNVMIQVYFQGLSCQAIADASGTPVTTIRSRLRAGIKRLQGQIAKPAGAVG